MNFEKVSLSIVLKSENHSVSDVALLTECMDSLICASIWAVVEAYTEEDSLREASTILRRGMLKPKARNRFYSQFARRRLVPGHYDALRNISSILNLDDFDPFDPLDYGLTVGLNAWLRQQIQKENPELYERIFSFAKVTRIEHRSPLNMELAVLIGAITLSPIILTYGLMRALARCRRLELEGQLREKEVDLKDEELKQRRIQTEILEELKVAIKERRQGNELDIPEGVLTAAATISSPAIAELSTSPLIGSVTLGVSTKT